MHLIWKICTHCAWYLHTMQQVDSCSRVSDMILEQFYCLYCTYALPTWNIHHGSIMAAKIFKIFAASKPLIWVWFRSVNIHIFCIFLAQGVRENYRCNDLSTKKCGGAGFVTPRWMALWRRHFEASLRAANPTVPSTSAQIESKKTFLWNNQLWKI